MLVNDSIYLLDEALKKAQVCLEWMGRGSLCVALPELGRTRQNSRHLLCLLPPPHTHTQHTNAPNNTHQQELRTLEARLDPAAAAPLSQAQRREVQEQLDDTGGRLRTLLVLAGGTINTLAVSTTEVGGWGG
jgi:hypothetical protein